MRSRFCIGAGLSRSAAKAAPTPPSTGPCGLGTAAARPSALVEQAGEAALLAVAPGAAVPGVAGEQREYAGRFGEDHLLHCRGHLAPARGLLQRLGRAGSVVHIV